MTLTLTDNFYILSYMHALTTPLLLPLSVLTLLVFMMIDDAQKVSVQNAREQAVAVGTIYKWRYN